MLSVFTVYDAKVNAYLNPLFLRSKGEAIRMFEAAANSADSDFFKWAADFTLFELGTFDEQKGKFNLHVTPIPLGTALEFKKVQDIKPQPVSA